LRELSQHILDLLQNGIEAGATRLELDIDDDEQANRLTITVCDNGRGMDRETLQRVTDPFYTTRTTRHVGLGLPLLQAAAERCAGGLTIASQPGQGTVVTATFQRDHIDRAPLGDMVTTVMSVLLSAHECDLVYRHRANGRVFTLDSAELREALGDVPLSHPAVRSWIQSYIQEGLDALNGADDEASSGAVAKESDNATSQVAG